MSALVVTFFCPQKNETAQRPGATKVNNVQLNAVRAQDVTLAEGDKAPNDGIFASPDGGGYLQLNTAADATAAFFTSGKKYKVTIEETE